MENRHELAYESEGYAEPNVTVIIGLIVGVGVATLVLIFVGVLGGQVYNQAETDIDNISDATIKASIKGGITSGFEALETSGDYLPTVVLAVIIFVVLGLVTALQFANAPMGGGRYGGGGYGGVL
jgi:hypothetical protein